MLFSSTVSKKAQPPQEEKEKKTWDSKWQLILTAIGMTIGLENIWRFPAVAYQHGGSAFLIPYLICCFAIGFPMIYAEFMIGQFSRCNPAFAYYRYAPAFRGLGLTTILITVLTNWSLLYLGMAIGGQSYRWTSCDNGWNTPQCLSSDLQYTCRKANISMPYATLLGKCSSEAANDTQSATLEFFDRFVKRQSTGPLDFQDMNWPMFGTMLCVNLLVLVSSICGVKVIGWMSIFTIPLPYLILGVLFVKSIFLEGAFKGISLFLTPNVEKLLDPECWKAALNQAFFSFAIGYGMIITLASHNKFDNRFCRDALVIVGFDTILSLVGGVTVFGTLGYLAEVTGKNVTEVVPEDLSLAFIAYPEVIATLPLPWLWNSLFFLMLFFLGFSTLVVALPTIGEFITTSLNREKYYRHTLIALTLGLTPIYSLLATNAGWYWFSLLANFVASTTPFMTVLFEVILLAYIYRWTSIKTDLEMMFGPAPTKFFSRFFSIHSPFFYFSWAVTVPIITTISIVTSLMRESVPLTLENGYVFPVWAELIGWTLNLGPMLCVPIGFILAVVDFRKQGISLRYLFCPTDNLPSYKNYYERKGIQPPFGEDSITESQSSVTTAQKMSFQYK